MPDDDISDLIAKYPKEHRQVGRSAVWSVSIHLWIAALVCLITYWLGIVSLKDLLTKGGAIAESGPAPEEAQAVDLVYEDLPPPPTPNPEFIREVVKPKVVPPPEKKPVVKPNPVKAHYTAPNAHGQGLTQNLSLARVGSSGLPAPPYPYAAHNAGQEGTVDMEVVFGPDGAVASAEVMHSSGYSILDVSTRNFVYGHWKNAQVATHTIHSPIVYDMTQPTGH